MVDVIIDKIGLGDFVLWFGLGIFCAFGLMVVVVKVWEINVRKGKI